MMNIRAFSVTVICINTAQILMSVREVQQSVIGLLTVLILMVAMSAHARLDSQEMGFSALVCVIIYDVIYMYACTYVTVQAVYTLIKYLVEISDPYFIFTKHLPFISSWVLHSVTHQSVHNYFLVFISLNMSCYKVFR